MINNMKNKPLNCVSLFASAGIGETYFPQAGIDVVVANELLPKRAALYAASHKETKVICGDITKEATFNQIKEAVEKKKIDMILASPPCQGFSIVGKNRDQKSVSQDPRNYLILSVIKAIRTFDPTYVLIENVPFLLKFTIEYDGVQQKVTEILSSLFSSSYDIDFRILDAANYGVPQFRKRAIIKMNKKGTEWSWPMPVKKKTTVEEAIGYLPSLEAGEKSDIKWHFARQHAPQNILWMKHTPTGCSAFSNPVYFPQKPNGDRINGFESSYRRIRWDEPAPTITIRNDCIASQRNVHPGRKLPDGTYSDARVLTPLELMILDSLPKDWAIPDDTPEILIRQCIGESIPPKMLLAVVKGIKR